MLTQATNESERSRLSYLLRRHTTISSDSLAVALNMTSSEANEALLTVVRDACGDNQFVDWAQRCEHWDFAIRQRKYVLPSIFRFDDRGRYMAPFLDHNLVDFALALPAAQRFRQVLYRQMISLAFPYLASFPSKNDNGAALRNSWASRIEWRVRYAVNRRLGTTKKRCRWLHLGKRPNANYEDFIELLRTNTEFRENVSTLIDSVAGVASVGSDAAQRVLADFDGDSNASPLLVLNLATFALGYHYMSLSGNAAPSPRIDVALGGGS